MARPDPHAQSEVKPAGLVSVLPFGSEFIFKKQMAKIVVIFLVNKCSVHSLWAAGDIDNC